MHEFDVSLLTATFKFNLLANRSHRLAYYDRLVYDDYSRMNRFDVFANGDCVSMWMNTVVVKRIRLDEFAFASVDLSCKWLLRMNDDCICYSSTRQQ